jgi:hypothetical protein
MISRWRDWRMRRWAYGARWYERTETARERTWAAVAKAKEEGRLPVIRRGPDGWEAINQDGSVCRLPCMCERHGGSV